MAVSLPHTQRRRTRRRRLPQEARDEALASARRLLLDRGPDAVTLKAVAEDLGMSHTNLLHHFGSAGELQAALMATMIRDLGAALQDAVKTLKDGEATPVLARALVDKMFDAFGRGGAGRLAAWLALSGNVSQMEQAEAAVTDLVNAIEERFAPRDGEAHRAVTSAVLLLALCAFADLLAGEALTEMLHRERNAARNIIAALLPRLF